jgi:short-subunit dehydrogenase
MDLKDKTALITGASSGLGDAFARQLASMGANIVITARRGDRLDALAAKLKENSGSRVMTVPMDLMDKNAAKELFAVTEGAGRPVEVLVNNAGFASAGGFLETPLEKFHGQIRVNVEALTELTYMFAGAMAARKSGYILNVASYAGHVPVPYYAVYAATKAYVNSLTEALHYEFKGTGVSLCSLCPGAVATEFWEVAGSKPPAGALKMDTPDAVAKKALIALFKGKRSVMPGAVNSFSSYMSKVGPTGLVLKIAAKMAKGK